jgi:hypothetical protein
LLNWKLVDKATRGSIWLLESLKIGTALLFFGYSSVIIRIIINSFDYVSCIKQISTKLKIVNEIKFKYLSSVLYSLSVSSLVVCVSWGSSLAASVTLNSESSSRSASRC